MNDAWMNDPGVRLEARLRELIACGYMTRPELVEFAQEYPDADEPPVTSEHAQALVDRLWRERLDEQATWVGETDPERLSRAFHALNESGITAQEDFTCCASCGHAEMEEMAASPGARGYVFFHQQGTKYALLGEGLTLYYASLDDTQQTTASVGQEVVAALRAVGLPVEWDGDPYRTITVTPLEWRKRLDG